VLISSAICTGTRASLAMFTLGKPHRSGGSLPEHQAQTGAILFVCRGQGTCGARVPPRQASGFQGQDVPGRALPNQLPAVGHTRRGLQHQVQEGKQLAASPSLLILCPCPYRLLFKAACAKPHAHGLLQDNLQQLLSIVH
jgi:hypothetical protein